MNKQTPEFKFKHTIYRFEQYNYDDRKLALCEEGGKDNGSSLIKAQYNTVNAFIHLY